MVTLRYQKLNYCEKLSVKVENGSLLDFLVPGFLSKFETLKKSTQLNFTFGFWSPFNITKQIHTYDKNYGYLKI